MAFPFGEGGRVRERRSFLKVLAVAPAAIATAGLPTPVTAGQAPAAPPTAPSAAGTEAVAEALAEAVRREHGADLDAAGVEAVRKEIARSLERAARMRAALHLGNADGPVTFFSARGLR
jgi:hypothetical protein